MSSYGVDPKTTRKNLEADLSFHITSQHGHNLSPGHDYRTDNDHLHLTDSHFSQTTKDATIRAVSLMTQDRFHSPTRSAASISPLGDQTSDVTTRADDRWARLTLLLWSQREEDWRERVKSGKMVGTIEPSTCSHATSAQQKGANQCARWENCTKCQQRLSTEKRDCWKEAKVLREKALDNVEMARRMEEQQNRAFRSAPRRPRPRARVPTLEQMNDQLRNDQPNKTESGPGPVSRTPTVAASSSANDHLEESAQGTGTASRVSATYVGAAITHPASSSTAGVCSDGSHSTARGNATSSNGVDIPRRRGEGPRDGSQRWKLSRRTTLERAIVGVITSTR